MTSGPATVTTWNTQASSQARVSAQTAYGHGPAPVGVRPVIAAPVVVRSGRPRRIMMPPGGRGSGEARPFGTVGGDGQDLDRDQRLPAPPRRHPGVPAQHGAAPGSRPRRRLRLHLEARRGGRGGHRRLRRRAALHRGPRPYDDAAADPARHPPGRRPAARTRLHLRLVRRRRPARPDGPRPAPRGRAPAGRHHPRARGRLGAAARLPATAAQDRGGHGHDHLSGGVHPLPDRRRAHPGSGRAHGPTAPASTRRPSTRPPAGTGSGPGSASPTAPSSSASPGWCRARARTR